MICKTGFPRLQELDVSLEEVETQPLTCKRKRAVQDSLRGYSKITTDRAAGREVQRPSPAVSDSGEGSFPDLVGVGLGGGGSRVEKREIISELAFLCLWVLCLFVVCVCVMLCS